MGLSVKIAKQKSGGSLRKCRICRLVIDRDVKCLMFLNTNGNYDYYQSICPRCLSHVSTIAEQEKTEIKLVALRV